MEDLMRAHCDTIVQDALSCVMPDVAVKKALSGRDFGTGKLILVAIGKAAWSMANAAYEQLGERVDGGIVITKYGHNHGPIGTLAVREAGHPVPDDNSVHATEEALSLTENLTSGDTVLFLVSGGGSALFESPTVPLEELQRITEELLANGADITKINAKRKQLSKVKGGKFALHCAPAHVFQIVLSDVVGDSLATIASGPAYLDTPDTNVETVITGSVRELCLAVSSSCAKLGYEPIILTDCLCCEAREAGSLLASIAATHGGTCKSLAFIAGGETVVHLKGQGLGGRNQELALAAATGIDGLKDTAIFSVGSDGTDGPTDAAGGYVDDKTADNARSHGIDLTQALQDNDAYHALKALGGLIVTGPTGTNVNDVAVALIRR